jgi:hypothetical protein
MFGLLELPGVNSRGKIKEEPKTMIQDQAHAPVFAFLFSLDWCRLPNTK